MLKIRTTIIGLIASICLLLLFGNTVHAAVFDQSQVIQNNTFGQGFIVSTSTSPFGKLAAQVINLASSFVSGTLPISKGGTGTSTAPSYGQILVGNTTGGYDLIATSTAGAFGYWNANGTSIYKNNAGNVGVGTTTPTSIFSIQDDNIGGTGIDTRGLVLANNTPAATGAQQVSPSLHFVGQGWKTQATAGSQTVDWNIYSLPVQGNANPSTNLIFASQVNGGGYTTRMTITSGGIVQANNGFTGGGTFFNNTTIDNSNLSVVSANGIANTASAQYQIAGATNTGVRVGIYGNVAGVLTANSNYAAFNIGKTIITTGTSGNHPLLASQAILPMTVTAGVGTVTNTASLYIEGAPTATVTGKNYTFLASTTNPFVIDSTGLVGVGTTSPWKNFSVTGDMVLTGALFDRNSSAGTNGYVLQTTGTGTQWVATSSLNIAGGGGTNYWSLSGSNLYNNSGTAVGIGTSSPTSLLNISGSDAGTTIIAASAAMLDITNSNTTNNNFGDLTFSTQDTGGNTIVTSKIAGVNTSHTAAATSGDLAFLTRNAGTIGESMRILANGNIGIGTSTPQTKLSVGIGSISVQPSNSGSTNDIFLRLVNAVGGNRISMGYDNVNVRMHVNNTAGTPVTTFATELNSGSLGIASTAPTAKLGITGAGTTAATYSIETASSANAPQFRVTDNGTVTAVTSFGNLGGSSSVTFPSGRIQLNSGGAAMLYLNNGSTVQTHANAPVGWSSTSAPSGTIDTALYRVSSGVVGIGGGGFGVGSTTGTLLATTIGVSTTTPGSILSVGGNGTGTNFFDNATTSKSGAGGYNITSGCYAVNGVCVSPGASYTATYPIQLTGNAFSLAFGTTTANTWSQTQTFTSGAIFGQTASPSYTRGGLYYDTGNESLTFFNNDNQISLQIGQEEWTKVINNTGSTIANGAAVYQNGTSGGLATVALAQANAAATTVVLGLMTETCTTGSTCYVTTIGNVNGIDTSGLSAGVVFLSATTPGALTNTAPTSPNYRMRVGFVTNVNVSTGRIHVTPSTAALGNGTFGQLLSINATGNQAFVSTSTLYTGTAGQVAYFGSSGGLTGTSSITINTTNSFVGIGTTTPGSILSVQGVANWVANGLSTIYNSLKIVGNLFLPSLATPAGSFLAVDANGQVIATTTPTGGGGSVASSSVRTFTSSATYNPSTASVKYVEVQCQAPGGDGSTNSSNLQTGGSAGEWTYAMFSYAQVSAGISVTVGTNSAGTNSSFGTLLTCVAGTSGADNSPAAPATGGTGALYSQPGAAGQPGSLGSRSVSGLGGNSRFGSTGRSVSTNSASANSTCSNNGSGYGYGGQSGASATDGTPNSGTGCDGGDGIVVVTEHF